MSDLSELYQELIIDHSKKPRNFQKLEGANHSAEGFNPLCGDQIAVYLKLEGDLIKEIGFQGSGCAISKASASIMTISLKGKTRKEAETLFESFHKMVTGKEEKKSGGSNGSRSALLGKLEVFSGVSEYPVRVKCATLAWHTLRAAFEGKSETVSTE